MSNNQDSTPMLSIAQLDDIQMIEVSEDKDMNDTSSVFVKTAKITESKLTSIKGSIKSDSDDELDEDANLHPVAQRKRKRRRNSEPTSKSPERADLLPARDEIEGVTLNKVNVNNDNNDEESIDFITKDGMDANENQ